MQNKNIDISKILDEENDWKKKTNAPGIKSDGISLFFDPVPLKLLGNIFKNNEKKHHTWFNGNKLYEYVVDINALETNLKYNIVETPSDNETLDETKWVDTDDFLIEYLFAKNNRKILTKEIGNSKIDLLKQISLYKNTTEKMYYNASKHKVFFKDNFECYAARVPHLILYPETGIINFEYVNLVTVGSNDRKIVELD